MDKLVLQMSMGKTLKKNNYLELSWIHVTGQSGKKKISKSNNSAVSTVFQFASLYLKGHTNRKNKINLIKIIYHMI